MPDFFTLSCPTCGGKLEITNDIDHFACGYCGQEHIVKRGGGIVSISPIVDDIKNMRVGVDKIASELGIPRLRKEIEELDALSKQIYRDSLDKYLIPGSPSGFDRLFGIAIKFLLHDRHKKCNIGDEDLIERIYSFTEDDLGFLIITLPKIKNFPQLYEYYKYKPFLNDLKKLKNALGEYRRTRLNKETQLRKYLEILQE